MSALNRPRPEKRLPVNPSIENLRKQAKRLAKRQGSLTLQQAQHQLAREYGSANWAELSQVVETMSRGATKLDGRSEMQPLPEAANQNDLAAVRNLLDAGDFTQHDLDLALARSVLRFKERYAIAQLLIEHGADPDGQYGSNYGPIVFVTGECLDPEGLAFLIDHGADVTFKPIDTKYGRQCPMSYALGAYVRDANDRKHRMIETLLEHEAYLPPEMTPELWAIHRGDAKLLARLIDATPSLATRRFATIPYGNMNLNGATLLHAAVEFNEIECVDVLLDRDADINARADPIDGDNGEPIGNQTPIFHCVATSLAAGAPLLEHLLRRCRKSIDLSLRATFRAGNEVFSSAITPLEWAQQSREVESLSWRRAADREIELLTLR